MKTINTNEFPYSFKAYSCTCKYIIVPLTRPGGNPTEITAQGFAFYGITRPGGGSAPPPERRSSDSQAGRNTMGGLLIITEAGTNAGASTFNLNEMLANELESFFKSLPCWSYWQMWRIEGHASVHNTNINYWRLRSGSGTSGACVWGNRGFGTNGLPPQTGRKGAVTKGTSGSGAKKSGAVTVTLTNGANTGGPIRETNSRSRRATMPLKNFITLMFFFSPLFF